MDYRPLPVGVDNFEKLMTNGYYFVDKSLLIKNVMSVCLPVPGVLERH